MVIPVLSQSNRYVRLAPTTLYNAPCCYLPTKPDLTSERCWLCPVKKQCREGQPVEIIEVGEVRGA